MTRCDSVRLWHEDLISRLPRQQLLGQHRECCALRGKGWEKDMLRLTMFLTTHPINYTNTIN